jgi:hypothetical protein
MGKIKHSREYENEFNRLAIIISLLVCLFVVYIAF